MLPKEGDLKFERETTDARRFDTKCLAVLLLMKIVGKTGVANKICDRLIAVGRIANAKQIFGCSVPPIQSSLLVNHHDGHL